MHIRKIANQKTEVSLDEPINTDWDGNELLLCLRCEAQEGTGEQKRCLAAFSPTPVSDGGSYHALIGGEIG